MQIYTQMDVDVWVLLYILTGKTFVRSGDRRNACLLSRSFRITFFFFHLTFVYMEIISGGEAEVFQLASCDKRKKALILAVKIGKHMLLFKTARCL